jgi:hypothetical protein
VRYARKSSRNRALSSASLGEERKLAPGPPICGAIPCAVADHRTWRRATRRARVARHQIFMSGLIRKRRERRERSLMRVCAVREEPHEECTTRRKCIELRRDARVAAYGAGETRCKALHQDHDQMAGDGRCRRARMLASRGFSIDRLVRRAGEQLLHTRAGMGVRCDVETRRSDIAARSTSGTHSRARMVHSARDGSRTGIH